MKIENERQLLPLAHRPWNILNSDEGKLLLSLFSYFKQSDAKEDEYKGWAYDIYFIRQNSIRYQHYIARVKGNERKVINEHWTFCPTSENDGVLIYEEIKELNILIVFHLHSFLWNYPTQEEMEDDN